MAEQQIKLGSGDLYIASFSGTIPEDTVQEVAGNKVGYIKGGASLEYKPTELPVTDDSFAFEKRFITAEDVTFKSGILTWDMETLNKLSAAGTYADDATGHVRTLKLGGKGAREMAQYVIRFVHAMADGNKFRVTLVGTASNGFSFAFAPDKETVIDCEFKAVGHDADGTKVILAEEYDAA